MTKPDLYKTVTGGSKQKANAKAALLGLIVIAVVAVLVGAGFAVFHDKSSDKKPSAGVAKTAPRDNTSPSAQTETSNIVNSDTPPVTNALLTTRSYASLGQYLADPSGAALYVYNKDTSGISNCTATCVESWPIYQATGATTGLPENVGAIKRADTGTYQYTYKGAPLYYYTGDAGVEGSVTGNGLNGFKVVKP